MTYFKPIVWQLLIGMVFTRTASFMTLPFLAIYMQNELHAAPLLIGVAVGISPLMSTFGGFFGGYLTDRFGRKKILLLSMVGWCCSFYGFAFAHSPWTFIALNALNGISRAFFEPASQAFMIDHTPQEKRRRLFSIRYTMINLSAVVGPLVGVMIANTSNMQLPFIITATLYIFCFMFFYIVLKKAPETHAHRKTESFMQLIKVLAKDHVLLWMIVGSVCMNFVYAQTDSTLSQILNMTFDDGVKLFSVLIATNAGTVLLLQLPCSLLTEKLSVKTTLVIGSVLTVLSMMAFYIADSWTLYIIAMFIISLGEIFIAPIVGVIIEMIAPSHQKATYLGVMQFQSLGGFFGPIVGSWLLVHWLGQLYLVMVGIGFLMTYCFIYATRNRF